MGGVAMTTTLSPEPLESGNDVEYITRGEATLEDQSRILLVNVPDEVTAGRDYHGTRRALARWADDRARHELEREGTPDGRKVIRAREGPKEVKVRTHYRAVLPFDRDAPDEVVRGMAMSWLIENFGEQVRAIGAIHRNTDNVHVHWWIDARLAGRDMYADAAKVRVTSLTRLRESWAYEFGRQYGRELADEYIAKARETTQSRYEYKLYMQAREAAEARGEKFDEPAPPKPKRVSLAERAREREVSDAVASETQSCPADGGERPAGLRSPEGARALQPVEARGSASARTGRAASARGRDATNGGRDGARAVQAAERRGVGSETAALSRALDEAAEDMRHEANRLALGRASGTSRSTRSKEEGRGVER